MCSAWSNAGGDQFDWTRRSGSTPSSRTGPSNGFGGSGHYMFIETSSPRRQGDKAILKSLPMHVDGPMALNFKYHMYGSSTGSLEVKVNGYTEWTKTGNQ